MTGTVETAIGSMTLRPDGILHVVFDFDESPTHEMASKFAAARNDLIGSTPPPVIVEIIQIPYASRAVRAFLMDSLWPPPCRAVVTSEVSYATMFRTFEIVDINKTPTKYFGTVEDAVAWIHDRDQQTVDHLGTV